MENSFLFVILGILAWGRNMKEGQGTFSGGGGRGKVKLLPGPFSTGRLPLLPPSFY